MRSGTKRFVTAAMLAAAVALGADPVTARKRLRDPGYEPPARPRCDDPRLYTGAPLADYVPRVPGTAREPYYDHGPDWGTDPRGSKPVYGIDPACYR